MNIKEQIYEKSKILCLRDKPATCPSWFWIEEHSKDAQYLCEAIIEYLESLTKKVEGEA